MTPETDRLRDTGSATAAGSLRILALVPDPQTCLSSLRIAAAAAAGFPGAHITALHVMVDPSGLATATDEETRLLQLSAVREGDFRQRRDRTFRIYREWLETAGEIANRSSWHEEAGAEEAVVDMEAAAAHLVTIARPATGAGLHALHAAIFAHRHLVLHTPQLPAGSPPRIGQVMAIAWKPTEAARRAIFRAERWLGRARQVHLITAERDEYEPALSELRDLGIEPQVHRIVRGRGSVGDAILDHAHAVGADSLVMGAFRRGAFVNSILGGVTHDVLTRGDLPAFLLH